MGQIRNRLCHFFEFQKADFIEHQCKDNRTHGSKQDSKQAGSDGIDHGLLEQSVRKCLCKIAKSYKIPLPDGQCKCLWPDILKCHCPAP